RFSRMLFGAALSHASAQLTGSGSPQNRLSLRDGNAPGFSRPNCFISETVEGTENQMVSPLPRMNCPGLINVFCEGQHTHAPRSQDTNMSKAERSKVKSNICDTISRSVTSSRSAM